jgi:hypothetical protein
VPQKGRIICGDDDIPKKSQKSAKKVHVHSKSAKRNTNIEDNSKNDVDDARESDDASDSDDADAPELRRCGSTLDDARESNDAP